MAGVADAVPLAAAIAATIGAAHAKSLVRIFMLFSLQGVGGVAGAVGAHSVAAAV
jgi:hypothetical protein